MKFRLVALVALLSLFAGSVRAESQVDTCIAKARQAIGSEQALNSLRSIRFKGTLETTQRVAVEGEAGKFREEPLRLAIDMVFQKEYQQRMMLRSDKVVETTALDGYDAWVKRAVASNESKWQLTLLDAAQVKRLRANTWENLNFYRGIEKRGGKAEIVGDETIDGRSCVKMIFTHDTNIVFTRFFEKSTGRLVKTITENGGEIREEGEIVAEGLRFPRKLINKAPTGQVATIVFESVTINESFPSSLFEVPMASAN